MASVCQESRIFVSGEKVDSNELEQSIVEKYDLVDVDNNDSTSLYALVETSLSSIINHL